MILNVDNLNYSYNNSPGKTQALTGVSFMATAGEIVGIIGRSGAGKSCLLHCLAGALKPVKGRIEVSKEAGVLASAKISLVIQEAEKLFFNETVRDEVAAALDDRSPVREEQVKNSLAQVGYEGGLESSPFRLSGGEQRKVALAALLIQEPDLLLLDEPTIGLDGLGIGCLQDLIGNFQKKHGIIIAVSHDIDFLYRVAGRFLILDHGRLVADFHRNEFISKVGLLNQLGLGVPEVVQLKLRHAPSFVREFLDNLS